ncbi:hypothetical protein A4X03_0g8814 [Tilletia caries]|uniref:Uncharacterized protein n=1 Tax=Tilletia caries TaxID=13290 RepID=A0A8T8SFP9_9BASI|nr:hypothetical protein A4X03_0g8814 [Tilletia caries]
MAISRSTGAGSKSEQGSSGRTAPVQPIVFKKRKGDQSSSGIVLLKDRRLLDENLRMGKAGKQFETLVDKHRLRIWPVIPKTADAKEVFSIIVSEFEAHGHRLCTEGQCGYEFACLSTSDLKFRTLGSDEQHAVDFINAQSLQAKFTGRECFIVVKSDLKAEIYDNLLSKISKRHRHEDEYDSNISAMSGEDSDSRSAQDKEFDQCYRCRNTFPTSVLAAHEVGCRPKKKRCEYTYVNHIDDSDIELVMPKTEQVEDDPLDGPFFESDDDLDGNANDGDRTISSDNTKGGGGTTSSKSIAQSDVKIIDNSVNASDGSSLTSLQPEDASDDTAHQRQSPDHSQRKGRSVPRRAW